MPLLMILTNYFLSATFAAYFYTSKEATFPSGYLDKEVLQKSISESQKTSWLKIQRGSDKVWVNKEAVIHFSELYSHAQIHKNSLSHSKPNFFSKAETSKRIEHQICKVSEDWLYSCQDRRWLHKSSIEKYYNKHLGYALVKNESRFYNRPNLLEPLEPASIGTRLYILNEVGSFLQVVMNDNLFFLNKNDAITQKNFPDKSFVYLKNIQASVRDSLNSNSERRIAGQVFAKKIQEEIVVWHKSFVRGHGNIWWQDQVEQKVNNDLVVSTKEILKKRIFDMAKSNDQGIAVISADGIYISNDQEQWRKIHVFENNNFPVYISADKKIFVGEWKSTDYGKTFEKFVPWLSILQKLNLDLPKLQIDEIKSISNNDLAFKISNKENTWHLNYNHKKNIWASPKKPKVPSNSLVSYEL